MEIIAEIGQNHNGEMDLAMMMIHSAKAAGADAVKFQLYEARKLFPRANNPWFKYNCKTELSRDQVRRLARTCKSVGIEFLASVFDTERVKWLEDVGVKRHKVASRSIRDKKLIAALCRTKKPLLVSLGMWSGKGFPEIPAKSGLQFLYCVSKYPAKLSDLNLTKVDFNKYAGFSDHTVGISAAMAALARGAGIIEKHFTLDKNLYGPDHGCSMTPDELKALNRFRKDLGRLL
ncbi:MAG: N-acetylneuraminate synthase family protein [Candidatus Omnitrophota bacterium]